jgi:hypothetical protein
MTGPAGKIPPVIFQKPLICSGFLGAVETVGVEPTSTIA